MFRKLTPAFLLAVTAAAVVACASDAQAGCYRGRCYGVGRVAYFHPIAPVHREHLVSAPAGSTLTVPCNFLGPEPGSAFMVFNNIKLPVRIENWQESGVTLTLPPMTLRHPLRVSLDVVTPHGKLAVHKRMLITPPADVILHPGAPQSPLPTNAALLQSGAIPAGN